MWQVKVHEDHRAFAQLVDRWEEPIRRLCVRMVGDEHRGEDLKQETFARLFDKRKLYQPSGRFSTYLWRIALNVCHDELRRRKRRQEFFPQNDEETDGIDSYADTDPTPDMTTAVREEAELVRLALMKLAEPYRTVLVLRHYEGLKIAKIAEILEIPIGTVSSRLAEGLGRLARLLQPKLDPQRAVNRTPNIEPRELLVI